ncbi:MAG: hypothetical protein WCB04_09255 [Mycobacteriales bacterium]
MRPLPREITLVGLASVALAVLMTWPTMRHPASTVSNDIFDPLAESWIASWGGHALTAQPGNVFDSNTFWPLANSYAFNDTMLGYAPFALITGGPSGALVRYNVLFVLAHALAFVGAYALARQLGSRPIGALVAGAAFAYAPWRLAHAGHLNILSSGAIPLSLAMLARGHGYGRTGFRAARVRPGWIVGGAAVAAWQVTLGFSLAIAFGYLLLLIALIAVVAWFVAGRPPLPRRLLLADLGGGVFLGAVAWLFAQPYLQVIADHPEAKRSGAEVAFFSPPVRGFFIAPEQSRLWGHLAAGPRDGLRWAGEMALLPGFVVMGLAVVGVIWGSAALRRRLALVAVVLASALLALGTTLFDGRYTIGPMQKYLPGWESTRTTGRLVLYTTLALGLLAAYAVTRIQESASPRRSLALLVIPALVLAEGLGNVAHPVIPPAPPAVTQARGPVLVLPTDGPHDSATMLWSTASWQKFVNGTASVEPRQQGEMRRRVASFPDAASVAYLQQLGVRTVVLLPGYAFGGPWEGAENRPVTGLPLRREQVTGGDWVYHLDPRPG